MMRTSRKFFRALYSTMRNDYPAITRTWPRWLCICCGLVFRFAERLSEQYGERQRPGLRSIGLLIEAHVADAIGFPQVKRCIFVPEGRRMLAGGGAKRNHRS